MVHMVDIHKDMELGIVEYVSHAQVIIPIFQDNFQEFMLRYTVKFSTIPNIIQL